MSLRAVLIVAFTLKVSPTWPWTLRNLNAKSATVVYGFIMCSLLLTPLLVVPESLGSALKLAFASVMIDGLGWSALAGVVTCFVGSEGESSKCRYLRER